MAGITTHVLDVTNGCPAEGVQVELYELADGSERKLVADGAVTILLHDDSSVSGGLPGSRVIGEGGSWS